MLRSDKTLSWQGRNEIQKQCDHGNIGAPFWVIGSKEAGSLCQGVHRDPLALFGGIWLSTLLGKPTCFWVCWRWFPNISRNEISKITDTAWMFLNHVAIWGFLWSTWVKSRWLLSGVVRALTLDLPVIFWSRHVPFAFSQHFSIFWQAHLDPWHSKRMASNQCILLEVYNQVPEAILSLALGFRKLAPWHWNRFIVPLERGPQGILAGHAVLGVQKPGAPGVITPKAVREALKRRKIEALTAFKLPQLGGPSQEQRKFLEMRDKQLGLLHLFGRFGCVACILSRVFYICLVCVCAHVFPMNGR